MVESLPELYRYLFGSRVHCRTWQWPTHFLRPEVVSHWLHLMTNKVHEVQSMEHTSVNSGWGPFPPAWELSALGPTISSLHCLILCLRPVAFLSFFMLSSQPCLSLDSQWPVDKSHISCSHLPRSKHDAARGLKLWPMLQPLKSNCAIVLTTVCKPLSMPALKHLFRLRLKGQSISPAHSVTIYSVLMKVCFLSPS